MKKNHKEYYRKILGLNILIDIKNNNNLIKAIVPYKDNPIEFYNWWCENQDQITMKFQEKLILFDKVFMQKPKVLKAEHRRIINK